MMNRQKVIVDCDAGSDDALALAMLVAAHNQKRIEIMAITCVFGNTHVTNVIQNVFRTLHACKGLDIPVYKGVDTALLSTDNFRTALNSGYHGSDGFGDVYKDSQDISKLKDEHAVYALQKITAKYCGEVTVICLAPLTNIALAIKMYPNFVNSVEKFLIMGGNSTAVGNITSQAEFNFYADPESVHIVMCSAQKKLWIFPWESCLKPKITHEWYDNVFKKIDTPIVHLLNKVSSAILSKQEKKESYFIPCDAFVAGIVLRPDIVEDVQMHHVDIELSGVKTRGQVLIDHMLINEPNAYIINNINSEIFKDLLLFAANPNSQNSRVLL